MLGWKIGWVFIATNLLIVIVNYHFLDLVATNIEISGASKEQPFHESKINIFPSLLILHINFQTCILNFNFICI